MAESSEPAFSGKVHIKVVRADEIRTHLGRKPTPMVMLRVSVGGVAQPDLMKTSAISTESNPEWGEEFVLPVSDARQSQLECTIWDTSDPQVLTMPLPPANKQHGTRHGPIPGTPNFQPRHVCLADVGGAACYNKGPRSLPSSPISWARCSSTSPSSFLTRDTTSSRSMPPPANIDHP